MVSALITFGVTGGATLRGVDVVDTADYSINRASVGFVCDRRLGPLSRCPSILVTNYKPSACVAVAVPIGL